ncbi:hypothetical protein AALO_G00134560 [Alosa alosa]|uniref:Uncharacterized protein n=1 Tax=Alosa alosa TaxID=278164 RepID=A0AAV6GHL9_9TELE|nr:hypothetical protein AALO_G00134560 [Alosa alosa]
MENCNATHIGFGQLCGSYTLWILFAAVCTVLVLSLCWNILCCFGKQCTAKGKCFLPRFRRSISLRLSEMEDNPIYGNITYTPARTEITRNPTLSNNHQMTRSTIKVPSGGQDCYANLKLKVPKAGSGRSSPAPSLNTGAPQIQYSDVTAIPRTTDLEDSADILETTSLLSDLYASVDNKQNRTKTLDDTEDYANNV